MTKLNARHYTLTLLACLLVAFPALAQIGIGANQITFDLDKDLSHTLTVSGPDYYSKVVFEAGAAMEWAPMGKNGEVLADGQYTYEIVANAARRQRGSSDEGLASFKRSGEAISGAVTLQNGSIVAPGIPERPATKDQVILDDLIVDGSICVGFDCVNGESFGFDTLRLKENNLRVHFDDTSNSASFPQNDWRITINDTGNGGANYFAIEDSTAGRIPFRVEAGAPVNTLYVEADGDVGIKTANPVVDLHVVEGNTPTLRLEQDGSDGFTPQTWDLAGNEANFFIRDVTNGSRLSFRIRPGAPESSIDIQGSGDIGIGTSSPAFDVHLRRTDAAATFIQIENANAATQSVGVNMTSAGTNGRSWNLFSSVNGDFTISTGANAVDTELLIDGPTGDVTIAGNLTAAGVMLASSRETKEGFTPIDSREVLTKVAALPILGWSFKNDAAAVRHIGPMAEDFHAAFALDGQPTNRLSVTDVNGITLAAVQGLNQLATEKDQEIAELKERLALLEAAVQQLAE